MKLDGFIGGGYTGRSRALNSQLCINLMPERQDPKAKNFGALVGTPGLDLWSTLTPPVNPAIGRGIYEDTSENKFVVIGDILYMITSLGSITTISVGVLSTLNSYVQFCENEDELVLIDSDRVYSYNYSTFTLTQITGEGIPDYGMYRGIGFIGGYILVSDSITNTFYWSDLDDSTSWQALNSAQAEGSPDGLQTLIVNRNELWLFGVYTYEVWYITQEASESARFKRIPSTLKDIGTRAPLSVVALENTIFWLGDNRSGIGKVWKSVGYEAQEISTKAIEYEISTYTKTEDAEAYTMSIEGHDLYVLTFPTEGITWVYDNSTNSWFQWGLLNTTTGVIGRHVSRGHAVFGNQHYTTDYNSGKIYEIAMDVYTDNSTPIKRIRSSPHIHADRKRIKYKSFELDLERGVGLSTGQGSDPQAMLEISNDGGYTYGDELWESMGEIGKYEQLVKWNRLGQSRDRCFKVTISDPVKVVLIDAIIEVKV